MASTSTQVARIKGSLETLLARIRDVVQVRADVTSMGGETFLAPALDIVPPAEEDPVPELSAAQMMTAMQAIAAVNNILAADTELHRKAILARTFTPDVAVAKSRHAIRSLREALTELRQLQADLTDSANGTAMLDFLTAQVGAEVAVQVVAELAALAAIDTTLNAGAGTRRKDLVRAAD